MDTSGTPPEYTCLLRGCNMSPRIGREKLDAQVQPGFDHLTLARDRFNAFDNYAVKVILHDESDVAEEPPNNAYFIGFLHRDTAMWVGQWIDAGWSFAVEVIELDDTSKKREHLLKVTPLTKGAAYVDPSPPTSGSLAGRHPANTTPNDDDIPS